MSTINLLSSKIYNRIAAGEVVERPYSVVKELVENSIDAKANNICVEIVGGGVSSIKVTDDGLGIEENQLKKALMPHATSKINNVNDLDAIATLGFRGEALASIASVSKISIISKPQSQEIGAQILADGEGIGDIIDCASPNGTEITVKNLFYNTPAREKFLKTDRGEEGDISSIMAKFILGNPTISFKYIVNDKTLYQSYGDGIESAMIAVYGKSIIDDCFYIDTEKNGIKIKGYLGKHYFTKANRTYQSIFLNGRYIVNQTISVAITNAYASYLMKRQYPFFVISIELPFETVDVNVHPNKTDVRFVDNRIVYSAIYSVVSKVLDGTGEALNIVVENHKGNADNLLENNVTHNKIDNFKKSNVYINSLSSTTKKELPYENFKFDNLVFCDSGKKAEDFSNKNVESNEVADIFSENKAYLEKLEKERQSLIEQNEKEVEMQQVVALEKNLRYIGQALSTYLIFDDGTDIYFVDQHAAHERLLYDKFMDKLKSGHIDIQPLLVPYIENVNGAEYSFLLEKIGIFNEIGIEMSDFGDRSVKISALPVILIDMKVKDFLEEILSDLNGLKSISIEGLLKDKIAQKACKAAIKSGNSVTTEDVEIIRLAITESIGLKCPHGRPVVIKITRNEIDKWFKRIV